MSKRNLGQHGASFIHHANVWEESLTIWVVISRKFIFLSFGRYSLVVQCENHWNSYFCFAYLLRIFKHHCATNQISPESHSIPCIGKGKGKSLHTIRESSGPSGRRLSLDSVAFLQYFYSPSNGIIIHRRVTPRIEFGTNLYTLVERLKGLVQEHNTMSQASSPSRTPSSHVNNLNQ